MVRYLQDDRNGQLYGRHVLAAVKKVRSLSQRVDGDYDMRMVMASFVGKLSFKEMCVVLKEQKGWRQVRDFFAWMKLQFGASTAELPSKCNCLHNSFAPIWASWKAETG